MRDNLKRVFYNEGWQKFDILQHQNSITLIRIVRDKKTKCSMKTYVFFYVYPRQQ